MTKDATSLYSGNVVTPSWPTHDKAHTSSFDADQYPLDASDSLDTNPVIVVIDSRPLVRECMSRCIEQMSGLHVIPMNSVDDWLENVAKVSASLVVFSCSGDITADLAKAEITRLIATPNGPPVTVMCDGDNLDRIMPVMDQGVRAYIPTSSTLAVAVEAIRLVRAGGMYVPASSIMSGRTGCDATAASAHSAPGTFTTRQVAVIEALRRGKANKIIAHELKMRESTVKVHVRNIMKKLNAKNRTEVAYLANQLVGTGIR